MAVYLTELAGTGKRTDPFRSPVEGAIIDLRPDASVRDGYALVATDDGRKLRHRKIGDSPHDSLSVRTRNRIHNRMGVEVSRTRTLDVLIATLMMKPNGWKPIRPVPSRWRYEIWLGELVWTFPLLSGGASDNFNRADENPIAAPWVTGILGSANARIVSNAFRGNAAEEDTAAYYAGAASTDNQYSQASSDTPSTNSGGGPCVRMSGTGGTFKTYEFDNFAGTGSGEIRKWTSNVSDTLLAAGTITRVNPLRIEAEGSTIRIYSNGALSQTATDSAVTGGQPAIFTYFGTSRSFDDWSGGDLTTGTLDRRMAQRHSRGTSW